MKKAIATPVGIETEHIEMTALEVSEREYEEDRFAAEKTRYINEEKFKGDRKAEYPPIGDQLDEIMKWLATETEVSVPAKLKSIAGLCMSVKSKYPKPEVL